MSTDKYRPSDPPTVADWAHLERRADANRRRGRRGVLLGVAALAIALTLLVGGGLVYVSQRDVPKVLDTQTVALRKINEVVVGLQTANAQREATSKAQSLALAQIVEGIARGFATPPSPDPQRDEAVAGLCSTAAQFRVAAGAPLVDCPG